MQKNKVNLLVIKLLLVCILISETNESKVSDMFRLLETLNDVHVFAIRSCMEIEGESLKLLEKLCRKPVIPIELLPPSLEFSEEISITAGVPSFIG